MVVVPPSCDLRTLGVKMRFTQVTSRHRAGEGGTYQGPAVSQGWTRQRGGRSGSG